MLWPLMPNRVQRTKLFATLGNEKPDFFVHRWGEYKSDVPSLRPEEIEKINRAADTIIASFATPFPVRAILLQGHADYDLRRFGKEREDFEMKISKARAREVSERLRTSIERRVLAPEQMMLFSIIFWQQEGLGSHRRVSTITNSEYERSLNRRVEIFFAHGARPLRPPARFMICPHGGLVTRGRFAQGWPSPKDGWIVEGCPFKGGFGVARISPCLVVRWIFVDADVIDISSQGRCLGPNGIDQGPVVILG